jgi:hypothetical protein
MSIYSSFDGTLRIIKDGTHQLGVADVESKPRGIMKCGTVENMKCGAVENMERRRKKKAGR